jgi:hypothetical protein
MFVFFSAEGDRHLEEGDDEPVEEGGVTSSHENRTFLLRGFFT